MLAILKAKTPCKDCGRKGHWRGDKECTMQHNRPYERRAHVATRFCDAYSTSRSASGGTSRFFDVGDCGNADKCAYMNVQLDTLPVPGESAPMASSASVAIEDGGCSPCTSSSVEPKSTIEAEAIAVQAAIEEGHRLVSIAEAKQEEEDEARYFHMLREHAAGRLKETMHLPDYKWFRWSMQDEELPEEPDRQQLVEMAAVHEDIPVAAANAAARRWIHSFPTPGEVWLFDHVQLDEDDEFEPHAYMYAQPISVNREYTDKELYEWHDANLKKACDQAFKNKSKSPPEDYTKKFHKEKSPTNLRVVDPFEDEGVWAIVDDGCNSCTHSRE